MLSVKLWKELSSAELLTPCLFICDTTRFSWCCHIFSPRAVMKVPKKPLDPTVLTVYQRKWVEGDWVSFSNLTTSKYNPRKMKIQPTNTKMTSAIWLQQHQEDDLKLENSSSHWGEDVQVCCIEPLHAEPQISVPSQMLILDSGELPLAKN